MEGRYRVLVVIFFCIVSIGIGSQYASAEFRQYPEGSEIISDTAGADGKQVFLFVEVVSVNERTAEMTVVVEEKRVVDVSSGRIQKERDSHEITVRESDPAVLRAVEPGSSVQLYGRLQEGSEVFVVENTVVDYRNSGDWLYVFGTSILGLVLAVGYFFRHWRIDWQNLCFQQRGES